MPEPHENLNGAMADYLTVPAKGVLKLPDSLELLEGALIEPVAVGASAALKCGSIFGNRWVSSVREPSD
ncbi:hypothetical protein HS121_17755 [bacterium]|nr:hypothetical protein [bacterium]